MNTTVDGEFQKYATESGAYIREHFFGPDPRLRKLVEHLTDDELQTLPRGGHDYRKLYAAYKLATEQRGAPTVILAKTIKGWTLGPRDRGPQRHPPDQEDDQGPAPRRCATGSTWPTRSPTRPSRPTPRPTTGRPPGSEAHEYLMARRKVLAGSHPPPGGAPGTRAPARPQGLRRPHRRLGQARRSRPPWPSPACCGTWSATRRSARSWRRSSPTRPAPSASSPSSPRPRSTPPRASATCRSTPTSRSRYAESVSGQLLQEGITEAGGMATFTALATAYATWGQPDAAGVPLLLDVRLPAGGRPDLGPRRHAGPGHPGRLHRRADHAARRGAPARRRPLAAPGLDQPGRRRLRPGVRLRGGRGGGGRHPPDDRAPSPEDRFWYLTLYNENYPMPPLPEGPEGDAVRDGMVRGLYRFAGPTGRGRRPAPGEPLLLGSHVAGGHGGAGPAGRGVGRRRRRLVGHLVVGAARATRWRSSGGTACTRGSRRGRRSSPSSSAPGPARWWP